MKGPDHYREAASLTALAQEPGDDVPIAAVAQWLAEAQVHATLAVAAAVIDSARDVDRFSDWERAMKR